LNALHVTYRFGRQVVGGAEHYLHMLSRALVRQGVDVEVWTTKTAALPPIAHFGVRWDNAIRPAREQFDGIDVHRYTTLNAPRSAVSLFDRWLSSRWRREERAVRPGPTAGSGYLGPGWYPMERYGSLTMRWTERRAGLVITDRAVSEVCFEAMCPAGLSGRFEADGHVLGTFETTGDWKLYRFPASSGDGVDGHIILDRTWQSAPDQRRLGIAVRGVGYVAGGRRRDLDLIDDHRAVLKRSAGEWIASLRERALARPWVYEALFFLLRAPLSPGMLWDLETKLGRYDVILAQMTPYSTLNYAVYLGRRHRVPVVLLPHFHLDDDFYHLRHYYRAFRDAAAVLVFSEAQRAFLAGLGARPHVVGGGGVDPAEFRGVDESGAEFRRRFGLGTVPLVLCVGRKAGSKRYDLVVKAVDFLNEHLACKLVMIGPDEDGQPISSPNVLCLGRQERAVVLDAYHAADVFVMMSESESFGMVFLEAWMAKKPVIGNRACRAVADLIADGRDGFLCRDELECAERLAELILDRPLARQLGASGHTKVIRDYTWDAIAEQVANLYRAVSGDAERRPVR